MHRLREKPIHDALFKRGNGLTLQSFNQSPEASLARKAPSHLRAWGIASGSNFAIVGKRFSFYWEQITAVTVPVPVWPGAGP
jgi:hypothetical protein